jgi:hypothetical protein
MTTELTLGQAAVEIDRNGGRAPDTIRRANISGQQVWTAPGCGIRHGCKGQRGYEVEGVLYASAADIVSHAERACAPALDRQGRNLDDLDAFDQMGGS